MKLLAFPRSENPYQDELYGAMRSSRPIVVRYLDGPTRSQTLNLLLLPLSLVLARVRGFRVLHVHWVYPFSLVWARSPVTRRIVEWWYRVFLATAAALGFKIVWTAHNLVPHETVFRDDFAARRRLVERCEVVIAHTESTAEIVRSWNARRVVVVPGGASAVGSPMPTRADACAALDLDPTPVRALYFGHIREYKGVDLLLDAVTELDHELSLQVILVGACHDPARRERLRSMAAAIPSPDRLLTRFNFVSDAELATYLAAADFAVFPFRSVTNSSSVLHALAAGTAVIIPSLSALDDIPRDVAIRYAPEVDSASLADALVEAATMDASDRAAMATEAARFASTRSWSDASKSTWAVVDSLFADETWAPRNPADVRQPEVVQ